VKAETYPAGWGGDLDPQVTGKESNAARVPALEQAKAEGADTTNAKASACRTREAFEEENLSSPPCYA
jgi:hypothetical protein